jgi:hypothetical protein
MGIDHAFWTDTGHGFQSINVLGINTQQHFLLFQQGQQFMTITWFHLFYRRRVTITTTPATQWKVEIPSKFEKGYRIFLKEFPIKQFFRTTQSQSFNIQGRIQS